MPCGITKVHMTFKGTGGIFEFAHFLQTTPSQGARPTRQATIQQDQLNLQGPPQAPTIVVTVLAQVLLSTIPPGPDTDPHLGPGLIPTAPV